MSAEGSVEYKALLYVPGQVPMNYFTTDFKKGLQLYSSGVMIMDKCPDLLPDHFSFVQGIVDTPDLSLNISREMLQHDRQLKIIANNIEKKVKNELVKLMKDDRTKYEQFWAAFGMQFKYALMNSYGQNRDTIRDLLLFWSSNAVQGMAGPAFILIMMLLFFLLGFVVPSSSGLAVLAMPIMAPLADTVGIDRYSIVCAYQWGQYAMLYLAPTGLVLATLTMLDMKYSKWFKFVWPIVVFTLVFGGILLCAQVMLA